MSYKAVIFDLDGTLVHTKPEHRYLVVGQTLKELGIRAPKKLIDRFWFEARREEIIKKNFGQTSSVFWKTYRKYDLTELRKKYTAPYDDIDFLKELKEKGLKLAIVTGAPKHIADLELDMVGRELFDAIVIANNANLKPKPHPHGVQECLSMLKLNRDEAILVGNSDEDVLMAVDAGVLPVLVMRGEHNFDLSKIDSLPVIQSLYDLRGLLGFQEDFE